MKRRLVIAFGVASLCVLAVALLGWFPARSNRYHGKPVKYWVRELAAPQPSRREAATAAIQALSSNAVPELTRLLRHHDSLQSQHAWDLAGKLPDRLGNWLRRQIGPLDATTLRASAARALALFGPQAQAAAPALEQALHDEDMQVRYNAAQALGHIGPAGMPALIAATQSTNAHVRYCAVSGLGAAPPECASEAAPALFRALADPDGTVSSWARQSLTALGTNTAPFLTNVMAKADALNQQRAAKAIGNLRTRALVVPPLVQLLHEPEPTNRAVAAETLSRLGLPDRAMVSAYLEALKDPEVRVRVAAAQGLAQARGQMTLVVPGLTGALEDDSAAVREAAARALGQLGPGAQPAVTQLTRLLADQNEAVRLAAQKALERIK